ncbi:MAG: FAD:protein FMN transferase, partial [Deltaproteobacteria bacterium]|nr:FAD:protein FMN transferase [Deltaproteobacteria bacterium]
MGRWILMMGTRGCRIIGIKPEKVWNMNNKSIKQRNIPKLALYAAVYMSILCLAANACSDNSPKRATSTRLAMGTTVTIMFLYDSGMDSEKAMNDAFDEIKRLSGIMNHYAENSEVSRLNREGVLENADPELLEVIERSLEYNSLTSGAFDITILPVIEFFKDSFKENKIPLENEIKEVLELVGSDKIEINGNTVRLKKKGMKITLDGLAKGYIVDMASRVLLDHGIKNHLINAGGDIKAAGLREDGRPWKVAIQDPAKKDNHLDVIEITDSSVATSGNYENYFDAEKIFHHIADPKTGFSPVLNSSASIIAPTAMEADALATA